MSKNILQAELVDKKEIAKDTWQFVFRRPKNFSFLPGQYTTMFFGTDNRDFTIASNPLDTKHFFIVTHSKYLGQGKKEVSSFKKKLFNAKLHTKITFKKPSGGFTFNEKDTTEHILLAGGIGVNVFYSMITYAHGKKLKNPLNLFVSFSKRQNIIFQEELEKIVKTNKHIQVIYSLSQDEWEGEKGRITTQLIQKYVPHFKKVKYLIAGGEGMVEDMQDILLKSGVKEENIRIDIFTGYQ